MFGQIPTPTGEYPVGIYKMDMTDETRKNTYGIPSGDRRLAVWIFYPALETGEKMHYGIKEDFKERKELRENCYIDCYENVKPADSHFPCIMYSHGYCGNLYTNTTFCADMASQGFVVVSISHPYEADTVYYKDGEVIKFHAPFTEIADNIGILEVIGTLGLILDKFSDHKALAIRQNTISEERTKERRKHITVWSQDNSFVLDQLMKLNEQSEFFLYKHIDFSRGAGLAGHSFGGCAAANSCYMDKRFRCILNFDGEVFGECSLKDLRRPYMRIGQSFAKYVSLTPLAFNSSPVYDISVKKVTHMGYSDWKYLTPVNKRLVGKLPGDILFTITAQLTHFFFNKYLAGKETAVFPSIHRKYAKIEQFNCKDSVV